MPAADAGLPGVDSEPACAARARRRRPRRRAGFRARRAGSFIVRSAHGLEKQYGYGGNSSLRGRQRHFGEAACLGGGLCACRARRRSLYDDAELALAADGAARYGHGPYRAGDVWFDGAPDPGAWRASAGADGEALTIGDVVGGARRVVGALRLLRNRPRDLVVGIALDWLHPAYAPGGEDAPRTADLAVYAAVDALFAAGYRRVDCLLPAQDLGRRRVFERCGFALEGVLKKYWVADERSRDAAAYALLNTDWTGGLKRRRAGALGVDPPPKPPT